VDDISKGVIPPVITDNYNGDFNVIKTNLNNMVRMMSDLLAQTEIIIRGAAEGRLGKRANADLFVGGWNQLVRGVNDTDHQHRRSRSTSPPSYVDKDLQGRSSHRRSPTELQVATTTSSRTTSTTWSG
jgi:hypothetical protein